MKERSNLVGWLALLLTTLSLGYQGYKDVVLQPIVEYSITELSEYPGLGKSAVKPGLNVELSIRVKRAEVPGFIALKYGTLVHIRNVGRKPASNVQIRVNTKDEVFIVQVHKDETALVERLSDIGRQGSKEVFETIPLMRPGEEVKLTFWYGIPDLPQVRPAPPVILVGHADGLGKLRKSD